MASDDPLPAALAEIRERNEGRIRFCAYTEYTVEHDAAEGDVRRLLKALEAALKFHERRPLYGNASTEDEPDACPHDPDAPEHFEDADEAGEWLCLAKYEADACSGCAGSPDGEYADWPCEEYEAILAALTGREAGGG